MRAYDMLVSISWYRANGISNWISLNTSIQYFRLFLRLGKSIIFTVIHSYRATIIGLTSKNDLSQWVLFSENVQVHFVKNSTVNRYMASYESKCIWPIKLGFYVWLFAHPSHFFVLFFFVLFWRKTRQIKLSVYCGKCHSFIVWFSFFSLLRMSVFTIIAPIKAHTRTHTHQYISKEWKNLALGNKITSRHATARFGSLSTAWHCTPFNSKMFSLTLSMCVSVCAHEDVLLELFS